MENSNSIFLSIRGPMKHKVFVLNKSSHDFSAAEKFGTIFYVTEGSVDRFATNHMIRIFEAAFKDSNPDDLIVPCSLNVLNMIAGAVFGNMHGKLNLLLFKDEGGRVKYIERNHIL
jgi:hypothetical protein